MRKTLFFQKFWKEFSVGLRSIPPKQLRGRPTLPSWPLSTFTQPLATDVPYHHPSTESHNQLVGKNLWAHQIQPKWWQGCHHLGVEDVSLKGFVFCVLVRPWVNHRWPPGAANWIKGHKLPWFGKGNSLCEETNWHTELWSTSPPRQGWMIEEWAELLNDTLLCWEGFFSGSITLLIWGEQD